MWWERGTVEVSAWRSEAMTTLSGAELARRAATHSGADPAPRGDRRVAADEQGRFESADVQRVRIAAAYEADGIDLQHVATATRERRMSFEYTDRIYPEPSPLSGRTVGDPASGIGPDGVGLPTSSATRFDLRHVAAAD